MWLWRIIYTVTLLSPLLMPALVHAQGYGALDDDDAADTGRPQQSSFPQNQKTSALPKYDSSEEAAIAQQQQQAQQSPAAAPPPPQQPETDRTGRQNLWWQNQNAFQRPPGHPGVEQLAPNPNHPPPNQQRPNTGFNALGSGQAPQQQYNNPPQSPQPPQQPYDNDPSSPLPVPSTPNDPQQNNPVPQQSPDPETVEPLPQQSVQPEYTSPVGQPSVSPPFTSNIPQQPVEPPPALNNPPPQRHPSRPQPQQPNYGGWNAPSQQYQQQGFGGRPNPAPGCDLVNKADCHNGVPAPPQNYEPPPLNPEPFPQQPYQQQQQQPVPRPNQSYRPPPPPQQTAHYRPNDPAPNQYQQQESYQNPSPPQQHTAHYRPNNPSPQQSYQNQNPRPNYSQQSNQYNPSSPPRQQSYNPPQAPRPRPQQPYQQKPQQHPQNPEDPSIPYPGCPAAMLCVQDDRCNTIGLIEENPIQLSAADRLNRVALMQCSEPMTGIVGVCCRDPNYQDPWPDMQGGGMMKKDPNQHHHHPNNGQYNQGQKSPAPLRPPQGNHLASGGGNPYSGPTTQTGYGSNNNNNNGWTRNRNTVQCDSSSNNNQLGGAGGGKVINKRPPKSIKFTPSPSTPTFPSESKQTLQVLEPCSSDELCISMPQCISLNPQFMSKVGLHPGKHGKNIFNLDIESNYTGPVKIKRCKYERSGVHYLCCKRPQAFPTTTTRPIQIPSRTPFHFSSTIASTTPTYSKLTSKPKPSTINFYKPLTFTTPETFSTTFSGPFATSTTASVTPTTYHPSAGVFATTKSSLITGVGLRFHSGLHSEKQKELNRRKPNPYGENEEPIVLISPTKATPSFPSTFSSKFIFGPTHPFRLTTTSTTTTPSPVTSKGIINFPDELQQTTFDSELTDNPETISVFARVLGTSRSIISSTTPFISPFTTSTVTSISSSEKTTKIDTTTPSIRTTTPVTNVTEPTTTEGKVDINKIPFPVPLRKEFREDPPIGFIFKGEDLFIPEIEVPSQNYLVPTFDFEARTFPPVEPEDETSVTDEDLNSSSIAGSQPATTIFSLLDESLDNSASQEIK